MQNHNNGEETPKNTQNEMSKDIPQDTRPGARSFSDGDSGGDELISLGYPNSPSSRTPLESSSPETLQEKWDRFVQIEEDHAAYVERMTNIILKHCPDMKTFFERMYDVSDADDPLDEHLEEPEADLIQSSPAPNPLEQDPWENDPFIPDLMEHDEQ